MVSDKGLVENAGYWVAVARIRFFRLSIREKLLMILFIGALLGVWLSFQMDRHGTASYDIRVANFTAQNPRKRDCYRGRDCRAV